MPWTKEIIDDLNRRIIGPVQVPPAIERFRRFKEAPIPGGAMPVSEIPAYGTPEYEAFYNSQANQTIPSMRTSTMNKQDLPKYQCHKIVQAMQIGEIGETPISWRGPLGGAYRLYPVESDTPRDYIEVSADYVRRHSPRVGGYYVLYEDGYESYSPKDAFEQGYTRLDRLGHTVTEPHEKAGDDGAQTALPLYDPESACPKCGHEKADTTFDRIDQTMRRACLQCDAVRWERPLDQATPLEREKEEER